MRENRMFQLVLSKIVAKLNKKILSFSLSYHEFLHFFVQHELSRLKVFLCRDKQIWIEKSSSIPPRHHYRIEMDVLKAKVAKVEACKTQGAIMRSRTHWYEYGEKNSISTV